MKVSKRTVPMDSLCIEHKGYKLRLMTHHQKVIVGIEKDGKIALDEWLTPEQLISRLMRDTRP